MASAQPESLSFSLKWQQWAYPVQCQCWSSWDVDCCSKTCTLDWVQIAADWGPEPSGYSNWSRIRSHSSCSGASCWRARRHCHRHSSEQPGGQGANESSPCPVYPPAPSWLQRKSLCCSETNSSDPDCFPSRGLKSVGKQTKLSRMNLDSSQKKKGLGEEASPGARGRPECQGCRICGCISHQELC